MESTSLLKRTIVGELELRLHDAVRECNVEETRTLLNDGADPKKTLGTISLLHFAIKFGSRSEKIVELLIENGCSVNLAAQGIGTPLHIAAGDRCDNIVRMLLNAGADMHAVNTYGHTPLATGTKYLSITKLFMEAGYGINYTDPTGESPLFYALRYKDKETIHYLLELGADVNQFFPPRITGPFLMEGYRNTLTGITPLIRATMRGCSDIISLLLELGADPCLNNSNKSLIYLALGVDTSNDDVDFTMPDPEYPHLDVFLFDMAPHPSSVLNILLEAGANVNDPLASPPPVLMCVQHGLVEHIKILIKWNCQTLFSLKLLSREFIYTTKDYSEHSFILIEVIDNDHKMEMFVKFKYLVALGFVLLSGASVRGIAPPAEEYLNQKLEQNHDLHTHKAVMAQMQTLQTIPRTLQDLCIFRIRQICPGTQLHRALPELGLPLHLNDRVLLKDVVNVPAIK